MKITIAIKMIVAIVMYRMFSVFCVCLSTICSISIWDMGSSFVMLFVINKF